MKIEFAPKFPFIFRQDAGYIERMPLEQREGLFGVLDQMHRAQPEWLPILRVRGLKDTLCLYDFVSDAFGKYAGMEIVFLRPETVVYHRLPGALPDGEGYVAPGSYAFRLCPFGVRAIHLQLSKSDDGRIHEIEQVGGDCGARFVDLPHRVFAYSVFAPEMFALHSTWLSKLEATQAETTDERSDLS